MDFTLTFDKHKNEPDISLAAYAKSKHIELGKLVLSKKTAYLDTKFWIILRGVALGRNAKKSNKDLFDLCTHLSESGKCIFPISDPVFLEVLKQTDALTLEAIRKKDMRKTKNGSSMY